MTVTELMAVKGKGKLVQYANQKVKYNYEKFFETLFAKFEQCFQQVILCKHVNAELDAFLLLQEYLKTIISPSRNEMIE